MILKLECSSGSFVYINSELIESFEQQEDWTVIFLSGDSCSYQIKMRADQLYYKLEPEAFIREAHASQLKRALAEKANEN